MNNEQQIVYIKCVCIYIYIYIHIYIYIYIYNIYITFNLKFSFKWLTCIFDCYTWQPYSLQWSKIRQVEALTKTILLSKRTF